MKKFWHKAEAVLKELFGSSSWEKTASATLTYIGPALQLLLTLAAGPQVAAIVGGVIAKAQAGLATIGAVVNGATSTPAPNAVAAAVAAANSIRANLTGLLSVAEIKNSTRSAEITAVVNEIVGELDEFVSNAPSTVAAAAPVAAAAAAAK